MMKNPESKLTETPDVFLDRVLSNEYISDLMDEHDHEIRRGLFHPAMVVWLMMYQRISGGLTLCETVEAFQEGAGGVLTRRSDDEFKEASLGTGGFSQARTRIPEDAVDDIVDTINEAIITSHPEHLWQGRQAFIIDGTDFRVLAEGDLKKEYPPHKGPKNSSPWSIIRSVIATHLITGVAVRAANGAMYGKKAKGEVGLSKEVIERLPENSIMLADKGLGTFAVAYNAVEHEHDVLLRLTEVRASQACGQKLRQDSEVSCVWKPGKHTLRFHQEVNENAEIPGRIIRHTLHLKGYKPIVLFFFTTLKGSVEEIVSLYKLRWNIETDFRTLKTAMKMELLDVRSASMARKEIALGIAAYNMVRHLLAYAAHEANILPRDISFTYYANRVASIGNRLFHASLDNIEYERILKRLTHKLKQIAIPKRRKPRSTEPRRVLRKPQPFPYMKESRVQERKNLKLAK